MSAKITCDEKELCDHGGKKIDFKIRKIVEEKRGGEWRKSDKVGGTLT